MLHTIPTKVNTLDEIIEPFLDRPISDLNPIELIILRMGVYELADRPDIPYRVIINECLELAKKFGAEEGYKYVNGVLDKVARKLRHTEISN